MTTILAFIFVVGVLIVLHEAGHFLMARAVGARVEVFSVGFGKRLWGFKRGDTDYRLSLVPIGGYVRIIGLGPDESDVIGEGAEETELLPRWQRALILLAGPLTNVIGAFVFLSLAFMAGVEVPAHQDDPPVIAWINPDSPAAKVDIQPGDLVTSIDDGMQSTAIKTWRDLEMSLITSGGHEVQIALERDGERKVVSLTPEKVGRHSLGYSGLLPPISPDVVGVIAKSPAERAGIKEGDRITAVNGEPVSHFYDLVRLISPHAEEEISVELVRDGEPLSLKVTPYNDDGEGKIGIPIPYQMELKQYSFFPAIKAGAAEVIRMTGDTFVVLGKLITRRTSIRQLSGPIEIARISGDAARSGIRDLIWFLGLISLQLGIFNLLPIPILDGGHLTVIAIESTIRRDLSMRVKERILEVGFYLLILLFVVVIANDIYKNLPDPIYNWFQ